MNIIIDKDVWLNSQLSIARYYGGININGRAYMVVPPLNDLVRADYARAYRKLGKKKLQECIDKGMHLIDINKLTKGFSLAPEIYPEIDFNTEEDGK